MECFTKYRLFSSPLHPFLGHAKGAEACSRCIWARYTPEWVPSSFQGPIWSFRGSGTLLKGTLSKSILKNTIYSYLERMSTKRQNNIIQANLIVNLCHRNLGYGLQITLIWVFKRSQGFFNRSIYEPACWSVAYEHTYVLISLIHDFISFDP